MGEVFPSLVFLCLDISPNVLNMTGTPWGYYTDNGWSFESAPDIVPNTYMFLDVASVDPIAASYMAFYFAVVSSPAPVGDGNTLYFNVYATADEMAEGWTISAAEGSNVLTVTRTTDAVLRPLMVSLAFNTPQPAYT